MRKYFAILAAVVALVAMSAPAWAQAEAPGSSFTVIGRLWTDFGYQHKSEELATNQYGLTMKGKKRDSYTTNFVNVNANSYWGAKWTSGDKSTGAHAEFAILSKESQNEQVLLRYAYGWWKMGNCKLTAGHTDGVFGSLFAAPGSLLGTSNSGKILFLRWGYLYSGRLPQVRFEYTSPVGLFSIALAQADAEQIVGTESLLYGTSQIGSSQAYFSWPRVDLAYALRLGGFMAIPGFSISQVRYDGVSSGRDDSVINWVAQLPMTYEIAGFGVKAQIYYGQNIDCEWGQTSTGTLGGQPQAIPVWFGGKVEDTKQLGASIELSYTIDNIKPLIAFGYVDSSNDNWKKVGYTDDNYQRWALMGAVNYKINQYFTVQPEVAYYNYGDRMSSTLNNVSRLVNGSSLSNDYGSEWLFGVAFLFVF